MKNEKVFTPDQVLAGSQEIGSGDPAEVAFHALAYALDTENLLIMHHVKDGYVHYIGAPAEKFVNTGASCSPLMMALKSTDGAYIHDEAQHAVLIIKSKGRYRTYVGTIDEVRHICDREKLSPILVTENDECGHWEARTYDDVKENMKFSKRITMTGVVASIIFGFLWFSSVALQGYYQQATISLDSSASERVKKAINSIPSYHPIDSKMAEFQIVKSVAAKSGGWVKTFSINEGKVGYELELPQWVTSDYIQSLEGAAAYKSENSVIIRKGAAK